MTEVIAQRPRTLIRPRRGWFDVDFAAIWQFRELLVSLAWRDVKVRYKQTVLGAAWAILQPLALMVIFTIVMGRMVGVPTTEGVPQPVFFFSGVLLWNYFANTLSQASNSVLRSNAMVEKVYFPRIIIPFACAGAAAIDFIIAFAVLVLMMFCYGMSPHVTVLIVPLLLLLTMLAALGVGSFLAALNVSYRDFRHMIPFIVQLWMFATPSIYMDAAASQQRQNLVLPSSESELGKPTGDSSATHRDGLRRAAGWLEANPMNSLVAAFRASILGTPVQWYSLARASTVIVISFLAGCLYFNFAQRSFADVI